MALVALVALEVEGPGAGVALLLWAQGSGHVPWMMALVSEVGAVGLPTLLAGALASWKGKPTVQGVHGMCLGISRQFPAQRVVH